jgi:hypothetical protein
MGRSDTQSVSDVNLGTYMTRRRMDGVLALFGCSVVRRNAQAFMVVQLIRLGCSDVRRGV